jgi:hypothetical protein
VITPAGGTLIELTDGELVDSGEVLMRTFAGGSLLPVSYSGLGFGGSLTFADAGAAGRPDELVVNASDAANQDALFDVSASGAIALSSPSSPSNAKESIDVLASSVGVLRLHGFEGNDTFDIAANNPFTSVLVHGGGPGSGSDTLRV